MTHPLITFLEMRLQEAEASLAKEKQANQQYSQIHTAGYVSALKVAIQDAKRFL